MTANKYHGALLVLLVSLGALAGCSGTETTPTATPTDSGSGTTSSAGGTIHELTIINRMNAPDGPATALTLQIRANTVDREIRESDVPWPDGQLPDEARGASNGS